SILLRWCVHSPRIHRIRTTLSYTRTIDACKLRQIRMAVPSTSYLYPCLASLDLQTHACRPAMRIFISPTASSWCPSTTIPMISKRWRFCRRYFPIAACLASPARPWSGAWGQSTVSHSSNQPCPPHDAEGEGGRRIDHDCTAYESPDSRDQSLFTPARP